LHQLQKSGMKKLTSLLLVTIILFLGCKDKAGSKKTDAPTGDPKAIVKTFYEKVSANDFNGLSEICTLESYLTLTLLQQNRELAEKDMHPDSVKARRNEGIPEIVFKDPVIQGEYAIVEVEDTSKGSKAKMWVKNVNGEWKLDLAKAK
jgi:hypothetical protein